MLTSPYFFLTFSKCLCTRSSPPRQPIRAALLRSLVDLGLVSNEVVDGTAGAVGINDDTFMLGQSHVGEAQAEGVALPVSFNQARIIHSTSTSRS